MPVPIVAGNWKMHTSVTEGLRLALELVEGLDGVSGVEKVICPPFVSLEAVAGVLRGTSVKLGAQNMHHEVQGAYTGEVAPGMLAGLCEYVLLGHSERRSHFAETDEAVNLKVKAAFRAGLCPIVCVGETLEQRESGKAAEVVAGQVRGALRGLHNIMDLVIAYEPVWAIGTGVAATPETASEVMGGVILPTLQEMYTRDPAAQVRLLYGGSVSPGNVESFARLESVHGALVGGASLRPDQFVEIARIVVGAKSGG
ncbi:MAG: triose-phosphate isomerase [Dehalococcoidia bacterium]|nr:triose-phosphate isomerase [Dehalococcoidia bacterium]